MPPVKHVRQNAQIAGLYDHLNRSQLSIDAFYEPIFFFFLFWKLFKLPLIGWKKGSIESRPRLKWSCKPAKN